MQCIADCLPTPEGQTYDGNQNTTFKGYKCLEWTEGFRRAGKTMTSQDWDKFPRGYSDTISSFCRNPIHPNDPNLTHLKNIWCYVDDAGGATVAYCNVPLCGKLTYLFRGYYTAVFISTRISRSSVDYQPEAIDLVYIQGGP